jgi:predicted  nucleic acid-binding Zn-ribbon protein
MPHQCLKCGKVFKDGSPQLLRGCPDCGGNRFFYTKTPLSEQQRIEIQEEIGKDIQEQLTDLLKNPENKDFINYSDNWITMKPKDIRRVFKKHITEKNSKPNFTSKDLSDMDIFENDDYRKQRINEILQKISKHNRPETIDIQPPGNYNIDIKGLLENEPIIIQKDGTYSIHLPSVFKCMKREKNNI